MANNNKPDRGKNVRQGNTKLTAEQERTELAKQLKIKPRTKAFVDELINNKDISNTEAYIRTHDTNNRTTASVQASNLLRKRSVSIYKASAVKKAKERIVTLVDSGNENIALKASQDIIDRTEGKAVQKSESINRTVEVKLDLSGARIGAHYVNSPVIPVLPE
jgi:hypothetical protein